MSLWLIAPASNCFGQTVIYTNLGANNSYGNSNWATFYCACNSGSFERAARFQSSATASVVSINLAVAYVSGINNLTVSLYTDGVSQPGTLLQSWTLASPAWTGTQAVATILSNGAPTLTAGQYYWLTVQETGGNSLLYWGLNNQGINGHWYNKGSGWVFESWQTMPAFSILGAPGASLSCTALAANQPTLRQEGTAEPAADIIITCTGTPSGFQTGPQTLALSVNGTSITSRQLDTGGTSNNIPTDAAILVNDNTAPGIVNGAPPPTQGFLDSGVLVFPNFTIPTSGNPFTLRITNVRVNANLLPAGSFVNGTIQATLPVQYQQNILIGFVESSLSVTVNNPPVYGIGQLQSPIFRDVTIRELYDTAFKSFASFFANATPGQWYQNMLSSESQTFFSPPSSWIDPLGATPGLANSATRIRVNLANIPNGVTVSLPIDISNQGVQLIATSNGDIGSFSAFGGTIIPITNSGSVTYEITQQNPSAADTFTIPMTVTFSGTPATGTATVSATYAPTTAEVTNFIPRFADTSVAAPLFTIAGNGCSYTLSSNNTSVAAGASAGSISVTAPSGCGWAASNSSLSWVNITSSANGSGDGTISYSIAANPNSGGRAGSLTIAGQNFLITQAGQGCQISLSPSSATLPVSGASGASLGVNLSGTDCQWTASTSGTSWVTITSGASGTGNGIISYTAASNSSATARSGAININVSAFGTQGAFELSEAGPASTGTGGGQNPVMVMRDGAGSIQLGVYPSATLSNAGGIFASDPSAAQDAAGNTYVTARDTFNSVWANVYTTAGTWTGWVFGGGTVQGVPSVAVDTNGTGWIAARDNFNSYWLVSYTSAGGFSKWVPLAGIFSTDPVLTSCSDGSIYVIGKDTYNSIWSARYMASAATAFQGWQFGGAIINGKPSAACGSDNAVYVAGEDDFGSNWMARVSGNSWGPWYFGGAITSITPRIAALGNGTEAVLILDTTGVVYRNIYTEGTANGWQGWTQVGGVLTDVEPAVGAPGSLYLAGVAPNGLWWWKQSGNAWTGIGNGGVPAGLLAAAPQ